VLKPVTAIKPDKNKKIRKIIAPVKLRYFPKNSFKNPETTGYSGKLNKGFKGIKSEPAETIRTIPPKRLKGLSKKLKSDLNKDKDLTNKNTGKKTAPRPKKSNKEPQKKAPAIPT
jgi:hypothetical protein